MSRRAARAYEEGFAPLSAIGRGAYVRAAAEFLGAAEKHHTSKMCNLTDFYRVAAVRAVAAQLEATRLSASDALEALRAIRARRSAGRCRSVARSRYAQARERLAYALQYTRNAARVEAEAATSDTQARENLLRLAATYRATAADFRRAAREA